MLFPSNCIELLNAVVFSYLQKATDLKTADTTVLIAKKPKKKKAKAQTRQSLSAPLLRMFAIIVLIQANRNIDTIMLNFSPLGQKLRILH